MNYILKRPAIRLAQGKPVYNPSDVINILRIMNDSFHDCLTQESESHKSALPGCPQVFDSVLCWPRTPPDTWAILPCFAEFQGLNYDTSQNATRYCHLDSKWDNYTNYDQCLHIPELAATGPAFEPHVEYATIIYFSGYILSLVSLSLAVIVFLRLKDLKCLRNKIHLNLFLTYILTALMWILTLIFQLSGESKNDGCMFLIIFLHYFSLTNFFWMLVEGLYLYTLVVRTFSGDNLRLKMYAIFAWGGPAVFIISWTIIKAILRSQSDEVVYKSKKPELECFWLQESTLDWIYQGPSCAVLIINLIFLIKIMWVLITKLRSANTVETRQYRKASKALLVLIPLLGITYLVVLTGPEHGYGHFIFSIIRAFLLSLQGFSVSLFYCFLNSEVRSAIRHRLNIWRDERNINNGSQSKRSNSSKDYIRSRTESIRLTSSSPVP